MSTTNTLQDVAGQQTKREMMENTGCIIVNDNFDEAQRDHDHSEAPEYFESEKKEIFDSIPSIYSKSEIMESWLCTMLMTKLATSGVYQIDLGEFSGSGSTKDEALKDLCEQIAGES